MSTNSSIWHNALWKNNPGLVQLLGLCPLMAVTTGASTALGLGLSTILVMTLSGFIISLGRKYIPHEIRIPIFVIVIASLVTLIQMVIHGYAYSLYLSLGIYFPLIVTNCIIIGRIESFAYKNPVKESTLDSFAMGVGMLFALLALGAVREILGQGTLFKDLDLIFGDIAKNWYLEFYHTDNNFLLATLAPGAFIGLGCLVAIKNLINQRQEKKQKALLAQQKQEQELEKARILAQLAEEERHRKEAGRNKAKEL